MTSVPAPAISPTDKEAVRVFRGTRIIGAALVAALALAAIGAASASAAAPEFGRCIKETGGKFENAGCTKEKAGATKFEWYPATGDAANGKEKPLVKNKFSSKKEAASEEASLESANKSKIECTEEQSVGAEYFTGAGTNNKRIKKLVAEFTGCKETTLGTACQNTAKEGEIVTESLEGELGIVKKGTEAAKNKIGVDLKPEPPATKEAVFNCAGGAVKIEVIGSVIHEVKANSMLLTAKEVFKCTAPAKQVPEKFEGVGPDILESSLNGGAFEHSCQRIKAINTGEEKIEANSVV
jgi:hypothetical protein